MKHIHKVLSCSCALLLSLQSPAFSDFAHTPGKSSVIVLQGEVTVDGQQRADLGRSFADTITGGLLKTKAYSVIDHLGNQPLAQAIEKDQDIAPEQSAVAIGKATGARWIYVPRMIVEGDFQKLTLKKIRVSDGQVVDVFESHATGERSNMFVLIGDSLKHIYKEASREPRITKTSTGEPLVPDAIELDPTPLAPGSYEPEAPETKVVSADTQPIPEGLKLENGTHLREETSKRPTRKKPAVTEFPTQPKPAAAAKPDSDVAVAAEADTKEIGEVGSHSPERKIDDPATELEAQTARYMGNISTINPEWRFCILKLRSKDLRVGDRLSVKTGKIVPDEVTLTITKIEGSQAVADLADHVELKSLKVGQSFYKWIPK